MNLIQLFLKQAQSFYGGISRNRFVQVVSFAFYVFALSVAYADEVQVPKREVVLEFEDLQEGQGFEVEFRKFLDSKELKKPQTFRAKNSEIKAKLVPGRYQIRQRSFDLRNVPGDWSAPSEFIVQLPATQIMEPRDQLEIKSESKGKESIKVSWKKVEGATGYLVEAYGDNAQAPSSQVDADDDDTTATLEVDVAKSYRVSVRAKLREDLGDQNTQPIHVKVYGAKLEAPEFLETHPNLVKTVEWNKPEHAEVFEVTLERQEDGKDSWKNLGKLKEKATDLKFKKYLATGTYRARVRALSEVYQPSDWSEREFEVDYNPRAPASIEEARSELTLEPSKNTYALAQYIVSIINFQGISSDRGYVSTKFNAVGGSGRVGLGHWFRDSSFGVLGTAEMSGFEVSGKAFQYTSIAFEGGYKKRLGAMGQIRLWGGAQYRELPETSGEPGTDKFSMEQHKSLGPTISMAFLRGITGRMGINLNTKLFYSLTAVKTPTGAPNIPKMSYMLGALGSYKLKENLVGFLGYAYREDVASYQSSSELAYEGGNNDITISGHYLNFMIQWGF